MAWLNFLSNATRKNSAKSTRRYSKLIFFIVQAMQPQHLQLIYNTQLMMFIVNIL